MGQYNSKVILCKNIKLEKDYKNVLSYTENQMYTLCYNNKVVEKNDFSFIRSERNYIQVDCSYEDALKCNYMCFQNPDYSSKWFFAFIDNVEYVNDNCVRIRYTIDEFSTWFDYWSPSACLVLREHVNSDNIGEHTYPENLEHGDYIVNSYQRLGSFNAENCNVVIGTTWLPSNTPNITSYQYYGAFSGVYYIAFSSLASANDFIQALDGFGRGDAIVCAFMAPDDLCKPKTSFSATLHSKINNDDGTTSNHDFSISANFIGNHYSINLLTDQTIAINTTLNGYTPKNKKLFCYPYNYLLVSNNEGSDAIYNYEDFISNTPTFNIIGTLCPGCSIKLYPENYKKIADGAAGSYERPGYNDGIMAGKFPICSFTNDSYVNWLTQQSVNTTMNQVGAAVQIGGMILNSAAGEGNSSSSYAGLFQQQASYLSERYQRALVAPQARGNINGGDVTYGYNQKSFSIYKMSIKAEYAAIIDEYFNRFGYQVNEVKLPNQTGRVYWNFVQIGSYENIGYSTSVTRSVPAASMETINNIYRSGVTIWHDHANLGNYSLTNSISS